MPDPSHAHDLLTQVMEDHGFSVTRGPYMGLATAWRAEFSTGKGPVIGVNSEFDALRGMGHACGHNLIAVNGLGVAIALKAAMQEHQIPGKIVLLGTPGKPFDPLLPHVYLLSPFGEDWVPRHSEFN